MTNFSGTNQVVEGYTSIPVHFTLYGNVEEALNRNDATIDELIERVFLELADIGNHFSIMYHHFEWAFEEETLRFSCASLAFKPGSGIIDFTVSLVDAPMMFEIPSDIQQILAETEAEKAVKQ